MSFPFHGSNSNDESQFRKKLVELPEKPPEAPNPNTRYAVVERNYLELKAALEKHYTLEELAKFMEDSLGIVIRPGTLRKYMNRAAKIATSNDTQSSSPQSTVARPPKSAPPSLSKEAMAQRSEQDSTPATSFEPSHAASPLHPQASSSTLSPERRERLTQRGIESDDDIESQFSL